MLIPIMSSLCVLAAATEVTVPFKQVGAPASEITSGWLTPPDPGDYGARGRCTQWRFEGTGDILEFPIEVPTCGHLAIVPLGQGSSNWTIELVTPSGDVADLLGPSIQWRSSSLMPWTDEPAQRIDLTNPAAGTWRVKLGGIAAGQQGMLFVRDNVPVELRSTLGSYQVLAGEPITLTAAFEATDDAMRRFVPVSVTGELLDGGADVAFAPTGTRGDSQCTLTLPAGDHVVCIDAEAIDVSTGTRVQRSVLHHIRVERDAPVLAGSAQIERLDEHRMAITLACSHIGAREKLLAGAEVWAQGIDGWQPNAWIGGMVPVDADGVHLVFDRRWLSDVSAPSSMALELRTVRLADADSAITLAVLDQADLGVVDVPSTVHDAAAMQSMRMGVGDRGSVAMSGANRGEVGGHSLILSHGYCSDANPWPTSHFSGNVSVYLDPDQNLSHDAFALDLASFGSQFKSFGILGHSQGGNAGLHLYSFYWSGLDWATPTPAQGGRLVQALGAPFEGTPLAGTIAAIGEIFGIQCGENYDMTYDGAALWLSYVPGWARGETFSWTTTFTDYWWSYDYCHIAADLLLSDPEDGVTESFSGDLAGANFMGLTEGWCHVDDMVDPPQCTDSSRNATLNAGAAR